MDIDQYNSSATICFVPLGQMLLSACQLNFGFGNIVIITEAS